MKITQKTILFVEDNPLVLATYRNRLQHDGFKVEAAEDGESAIEKLPKLKPHLVILDLMLPKLNGEDVLKFIRTNSDLMETPVLILSNAYMDERISNGMAGGANKRLLKTQCTPAKLNEAVRELLGIAVEQTGADSQINSMLAELNGAILNEARAGLLKDSPTEVAKIREHCLAFVKAGGSAAGTEQLNQLYQRVRFLCARAGLGDCTKIAHLSSALEAILFEIIFKKSTPSPSALQTIAQAVDCLGRLFQNQQIDSLDSTLKAKVLIVDDDPVCNFATVAAMKRAKLEAVSTEDPIAAVELAQSEHYDLVLLDINMPGLTGFEVCEKIRHLSGYQKTPVIFVTSNSEFQNRAKAVLSGGNDLIAKPISPLELALKTIMHLIEPREPGSVKGKMEAKTQPALAAIQPPAAKKSEKSDKLDIKIKMPAPLASAGKIEIKTDNAKTVSAQDNSPSQIKIEEPKISAPEIPVVELPPVNRIFPLPTAPNLEIAMKTKNENSQPLDKLAHEVTRIIFGDEKLSDMSVRLTRIALERYDVPKIISGAPATNGSKNDAPFDRVNREVARIIFGDEEISEMHLRLTRIALERYEVPEIINSPAETNWRNGSNGSYIPAAVNL